ncbi:unnamed protein product, partial [Ectocarpus sp. 12 AP-2014]
HHRYNNGGGASDASDGAPGSSRASDTSTKAAKALGGLAPNWNDLPSPPNWASMVKSKNGGGGGGGGGRNDSVVSRGASMSARTEGMTTWASNSSNTSSNMRSG